MHRFRRRNDQTARISLHHPSCQRASRQKTIETNPNQRARPTASHPDCQTFKLSSISTAPAFQLPFRTTVRLGEAVSRPTRSKAQERKTTISTKFCIILKNNDFISGPSSAAPGRPVDNPLFLWIVYPGRGQSRRIGVNHPRVSASRGESGGPSARPPAPSPAPAPPAARPSAPPCRPPAVAAHSPQG